MRIGFVLSDDKGYIFGMPPFMVEGPSSLKGYPNAVRATPDQIEAIVAAIPRPETRAIGSASSNPAAGQSSSSGRRIDLEPVLPAEVRQIEESIHSNPVQDFDLGRIVQVFSAYVQFVELKVEGAQLEARKVKLPDELLTIIKDEKTRARVSAAFRIVSDDRLGGDWIRATAHNIRRRLIPTHPKYGGVSLKAKRKMLDEEVAKLDKALAKHKETVRQTLGKEIEKSKQELVSAFWEAVRNSPPPELLAQIAGDEPTDDEAKVYLKQLLDRDFPDAERVCEAMKVSIVTKDVTWETLNDEKFVEWLERQFPLNRDLKRPFEEYKAARQKPNATVVARV